MDEKIEVGKIDAQLLLQNLAEAQRGLQDERRNSQRAIAGERERARWEIERLRKESDEKVLSFQKENEALARALGRHQQELDILRLENAVLKSERSTVKIERDTPPLQAGHAGQPAPISPGNWVPGNQIAQKTVVIPTGTPALGKPVNLRPEGSDPV